MTNDSGFCHNNYIGGLVPDLLPTVCFKLHTNMSDASQSFMKIFELNLNPKPFISVYCFTGLPRRHVLTDLL